MQAFTDCTVLVIDDHPLMVQLLTGLLTAMEFGRIDQAGNGLEGLRRLSGARYDLVLLDWNLGSVPDGLDVLRALKADPAQAGTKVLMLSATSRTDLQVEARQAGADGYLVKPFSAETLRRKLAAILKRDAG